MPELPDPDLLDEVRADELPPQVEDVVETEADAIPPDVGDSLAAATLEPVTS